MTERRYNPDARQVEGGIHDDAEDRAIIQALIAQGVDYSTAQDKAYMAQDLAGEATAKGGLEATVKALALVLGTDQAHATETILLSQGN